MKLWVGVPCYGGIAEVDFFQSILENAGVFGKAETRFQIVKHESLIPRGRNTIAESFLQSDATHLLFLDADLIYTGADFSKLLNHDKDIICGMYAKKKMPLEWVVNLMQGERPDTQGLLKVRYAGTGCMLIARRVFERMIEAHPEIEFDLDDDQGKGKAWDFFSCGVVKRRYLSEDWYFCQRWLDLGGEIFVDVTVRGWHIGKTRFPITDVTTAELKLKD